MTEEELDLLASAYVDGEATQEEVALVERDPALLARVEAMRAMSAQLAVPPVDEALKEAHLGAAIAAFGETAQTAQTDEIADAPAPTTTVGAGGGDGGGDVVDFGQRAADRSAPRQPRQRRERQRWQPPSMPSWLPAAAAFVLIGGGLIWAVSNVDGSDDFDTAATEAGSDESDDAEDAGEDSATFTQADAAESAEASSAEAESIMADDDAMADDAMDDEAMEESAADEDADAGEADGDDTSARSTTTGGFFPDEPVLFFGSLPSSGEAIAAIDQDLRDPGPDQCFGSFDAPPGAELIGYLPIEVDGELAELYLFDNGDGTETPVIVDLQCELFG